MLALALAAAGVHLALYRGAAVDSASSAQIEAGAPIPDLQVRALETGVERSLAELARGAPVTIVNVWASWCQPCMVEMPILARLHAREPGVRVVSLNIDDAAAAAELARSGAVAVPIFAADRDALERALGLSRVPLSVFVDADGRVLGSHVGVLDRAQEGRIERWTR